MRGKNRIEAAFRFEIGTTVGAGINPVSFRELMLVRDGQAESPDLTFSFPLKVPGEKQVGGE